MATQELEDRIGRPTEPARTTTAPAGHPGPGAAVHRLRDLDRSDRWLAAGFATLLLLAPVLAFVHYVGDWVPSGDPALMGIRALDVGTAHTPSMGQPSLSHLYGDADLVRHLGASHYYLLAPFVRLLGASVGMLVVSVLITGTSLLLTAWATFRQLGRQAGVLAVLILAAIAFTTGASSLVNPVSSSIAGYPFLCSTVLLWCLLSGDVRLLPLTVAVVSFAAHQHLSVLPALGLASLVVLIGLVVTWARARRRDRQPDDLRQRRWLLGAGAVSVVMWAPLAVQELFGTAPNLSRLVEFTMHDDRPTLGFATGFGQVVNVLGLPPILGQRNLSGEWLFQHLSPLTWVSAALVVAIAAVVGVRWRRDHPRRSALVVMVAVLAVGGFWSGASVPRGIEQHRLVFYHWAFALAFFVILTLALALGDVTGRLRNRLPASARHLRTALVAAAALAVALPGVLSTRIDRWENTLLAAYAPLDRRMVEDLADQVMRQSDDLDGSVVLIARGQAWSRGLHEALALELLQRGVSLSHAWYDVAFVADQRLADRATVDVGLVLTAEALTWEGRTDGLTDRSRIDAPPIAEIQVPEDFDQVAYETLGRPFSRPRRLQVFLLDRDELLAWATRGELR